MSLSDKNEEFKKSILNIQEVELNEVVMLEAKRRKFIPLAFQLAKILSKEIQKKYGKSQVITREASNEVFIKGDPWAIAIEGTPSKAKIIVDTNPEVKSAYSWAMNLMDISVWSDDGNSNEWTTILLRKILKALSYG